MNNQRKALLYGLVAVLLWSTTATAIKIALETLDVFQILFFSTVSSATVLGVIIFFQRKWKVLFVELRRNTTYFIAIAVLNPLTFYFLLLQSYGRLPAQQAQTINYTWAITLSLLSVPLLGQRLRRVDSVAMMMGYTGVVIIATEGNPLSLNFTDGVGVFFALASTIFWAVYWIINARQNLDPIVSLTINFLLATPVACVLCMIFSSPISSDLIAILPALYIGIFEMGFAYVFWFYALRKSASVSSVASLIFLSPILSLVFIWFVLEEAIKISTLIGLSLIMPSVYLQNRLSNAS